MIHYETRQIWQLFVESKLQFIIKRVELIICILSASHLLLFDDHLSLKRFILLKNVFASEFVVVNNISEILDNTVEAFELLSGKGVLSLDAFVLLDLLDIVLMLGLQLLQLLELNIQLTHAFIIQMLLEVLINLVTLNRIKKLVPLNSDFLIHLYSLSSLSRKYVKEYLPISFQVICDNNEAILEVFHRLLCGLNHEHMIEASKHFSVIIKESF